MVSLLIVLFSSLSLLECISSALASRFIILLSGSLPLIKWIFSRFHKTGGGIICLSSIKRIPPRSVWSYLPFALSLIKKLLSGLVRTMVGSVFTYISILFFALYRMDYDLLPVIDWTGPFRIRSANGKEFHFLYFHLLHWHWWDWCFQGSLIQWRQWHNSSLFTFLYVWLFHHLRRRQNSSPRFLLCHFLFVHSSY